MRIEALDEQENAVARTDLSLGQIFPRAPRKGLPFMRQEWATPGYYLAPFFWGMWGASGTPTIKLWTELEETVTIPVDELQKVKGCRALIEEVRTK